MTNRTTEIQTLIADIDNLLAQKGNRLPKILSGQGQEPRQVLERTRDFLIGLRESEELAGSIENQREQQSQLSPLLARFVDQSYQPNQEEGTFVDPTRSLSAFSALLMPLQTELQGLLQERANLVQEIRQLEQKRLQNYSLAQQLATQEKMISEFLQVLMSRLTSTLTSHKAETTANSPLEPFFTINASSSYEASKKGNTELAFSSTQSLPESPDQVERLTRLAKELDQQLLGLDGTVNVVFEALQRNIHTYHESLSQALARMHSKGVQGEQLIAIWINNLMEQLQQQKQDHNPSLNVQNETLSPTVLSVTTAQTLNPRVEFKSESHHSASHSLAVTQVNTNSTLANNYKHSEETLEQASSTPNLDAMLLQLNRETQNYATKVVELQPGDSELIGDEVDQLYASLFGADNLTDSSLKVGATHEVTDVTNKLSVATTTSPSTPALANAPAVEVIAPPTIEVTDVTHESSGETTAEPQAIATAPAAEVVAPTTIEVTDTHESNRETTASFRAIATAPTAEVVAPTTIEVTDTHESTGENTVQTLRPNVSSPLPTVMPDPWFDEPDAGLLDLRYAHTQDNSVKATGQLSDLYNTLLGWENTEIIPGSVTTPNFIEEPPSTDTITVLSDLFVSVDSSEQLSEVPSSDIALNTIAPAQTSSVIINTSDNYISASPQENLLAQEDSPTIAVADISLEEEQLRQLEQDLANFDAAINLQLQAVTNLENQETTRNTRQGLEVAQPLDAKLDLNAIGIQVAEAERKKEVIIERPSTSLLSISNSIDNTESLNTLGSVWYLGIDLGTTGISAALLNRSTTEVYPLYWSTENQPEASSIKRSFRLPAEVYLPTASITYSEIESKEAIEQTIPAAVAEEFVPDNLATNAPPISAPEPTYNLFSALLKPYLQVALPYKSERQKWEPVLQLNEFSTVPLVWVVRSLSKLLLTLKSDSNSTTLGLTAAAANLSLETFRSIINNIAGVICTCPSNWSEQYRFNVREALLISKLVQHPQQVFFVEEAIASLLSELDGANGEAVTLNTQAGSRPASSSDRPIVGSTLVINIGAALTEMALVDLPENLEDLTHSDFMLHGFAYAGKGIEQDIICQLLFPLKWRKSRTEGDSNSSKPWHWQPAIPGLDQMYLSSLKWEELNLPRAGEPDITDRIHLQQRLESSVLGKAMIDAAIALKLILQHQDSFTLQLADQSWMLQRRDLESQVFVPFVRRLNRELNRLLVAKGIPTEAINQAIVTGGVTSIGAVSRWLRQKLPNAKIIQDSYLGENGAPTCSRVAYGLAMLPLHPQVLDVPRQQYTDYFLFTELLRLLPERALSFDEVIQLFENRGINTRNCQQRLLAFLEGELPPGLIPSNLDSCWLTARANENSEYQAITAAPLFEKQGSLTYRPNSQQLQFLCHYLDKIKASTQQSLEEPYTVNFAVGVVN